MNNINDVRQRVTSIASKYGKIKNVRTIGESEKVLSCSFTNVKVKGEKTQLGFALTVFRISGSCPLLHLRVRYPECPVIHSLELNYS